MIDRVFQGNRYKKRFSKKCPRPPHVVINAAIARYSMVDGRAPSPPASLAATRSTGLNRMKKSVRGVR